MCVCACVGAVKLWLLRLLRSAVEHTARILRLVRTWLHFRLSTTSQHSKQILISMFSSFDGRYVQGNPKMAHHFCKPYKFVKYWPIFNFFVSLSESGV